MICPHCLIAFHLEFSDSYIGQDKDGGWALRVISCPACKRLVLFLLKGLPGRTDGKSFQPNAIVRLDDQFLIRPKGHGRPPCPKEVPAAIADDYTEACLVLSDSPKASAALSRRCLQHLLRSAAGVKHGDLANEIQQVIDGGGLPTHLVASIDAVRNIGNFAAHPQKSQHTGEILPVEPGEAEWTLEVLEALFDFYYVQPAITQSRRALLDKKLADAGKPPMKGGSGSIP